MKPTPGSIGCRLALALLFGVSGVAQAGPSDPAPLSDSWWRSQFRYQKDQLSGGRDVCLIGDSLTAGWATTGRLDFEKMTAGHSTVNCGISGDTSQNILWRIENYDLASKPPRLVVLMMGTNNLSAQPPDAPMEVAAAITKAVDTLHQSAPDAHIVLISILPNGEAPDSELRQSIKSVNAEIARLSTREHVTWLDVHDAFLDEAGVWRPELSLDGTHLSADGYSVLAKSLAPVIQEKLAVKPVPDSAFPFR